HFQKCLKIIRGDLVPKTAAAAVKHHDDLVWDRDSKFLGKLLVAHVFWPRDLNFQVMIAAAQGADLVVAPIHRALADLRSVGAGDATVLLGNIEVILPAVTALNAPECALFEKGAKTPMRQFKKSVTADSCWNLLIEPVNDLMQMRLHFVVRKIGDHQPHPTVDVEANAAG